MIKIIKNSKSRLVFLSLIFLSCFLFGEINQVQAVSSSVLTQSSRAVSSANTVVEQPFKINVLDMVTGGLSIGSGVLLKMVNVILFGIYSMVLGLFAVSMWLLNVVISPALFDTVFFSPVARAGINTAWSFVRDFFNLFFILIIVLIGLSTILGVSKFKDKTMLIRVVFAAMLINFSKPLTLFVIDLSQVFMRFFAESITNMQFAAQLGKLINFEGIVGAAGIGFENNFAYFVIIIIAIVMIVVMTVMIFYLAISLVVRLIAFWVLIILSPLAMFGIAMEGTKLGSMKDEWLKDLMSWCFYGPILLFFLWLSIILVSVIADVMAESQTLFNSVVNIQNLDANNELSNFFMKLAGMLIPYITAIYLLFYGYDKAKSTSSGMATKILDAGSKKISDLGAKTRTAAYQTTLPGTREAMSEAAKNRMEKHEGSGQWITRRLTKKGREDLQSERTAKWKGGVIGGDKGVAEREYYRGKAQETLKEWKNNPPDNNKLEKMFNSSSEAERVAATLYRSQNNQLGFDKNGNNLYTQGLKNLEGHDGLKNSITRETGRENIAAVIDQEIESRGYGNSDPVGAVKIQELYQQKLGKKNNRALFKDQNREFYLKEGALRPEALEYLYERSKGLDKDARAKMADAGFFKDQQVYQELAKTDEGKVILGITA